MVCFISSCDVSAAVPYPNEIGQGTYTEMPWTFFFFFFMICCALLWCFRRHPNLHHIPGRLPQDN